MNDVNQACAVRRELALEIATETLAAAAALEPGMRAPWRFAHDARPDWRETYAAYRPDLVVERTEGATPLVTSLLFRRDGQGLLSLVMMTDSKVDDPGVQLPVMSRMRWNDHVDRFVVDVVQAAGKPTGRFEWRLGPDRQGPGDWFSSTAVRLLAVALGDLLAMDGDSAPECPTSWLRFLSRLHVDGHGLHANFANWMLDVQFVERTPLLDLLHRSTDIMSAFRIRDELGRIAGPVAEAA